MTIEGLIATVAPLTGALRISAQADDGTRWIGREQLCDPDAEPLAGLAARFAAAGFGANRKAVSASLLLRFGWAAGFHLAARLNHGVVVHVEDCALGFSASTLVEGILLKSATVEQDAGSEAFRTSLLHFAAPLVEHHHLWSGFSRHALWAMVASSWHAQAMAIADRIDRRAEAIAEMAAVFDDGGILSRAAPDIYEVGAGTRSQVCQRRAACCLYFKGPRRHFCASCPIIPAAERLDRNRSWVAEAA